MRSRPLATVAVVAVLALTGCTGGDDQPTEDPTAQGAAATAAGTARTTADAVLAEQTFDARAADAGEDAPGGTVTATLRSLEVSGQTMVLRWAMRWDDDAAEDDATASMYDLQIGTTPQLTDTQHLKQYLPLCTEGSWQGGPADSTQCAASALVAPDDVVFTELANHRTVEAWAVFAAPQDDDASLEVLLSDGWPTFAGVTPVAAP